MLRYFSFANRETILVTSLDVLEKVMVKNAYAFVKPGYYWRIIGSIAGKGLLFSEGEEHKAVRRFMNGELVSFLSADSHQGLGN